MDDTLKEVMIEGFQDIGLDHAALDAKTVKIKPAQPPPVKTPILHLPNEVLQRIFEHVESLSNELSFENEFKTKRALSLAERKADLRSLALTCRRFYPLSLPPMYANPRPYRTTQFGHEDHKIIGLLETLIRRPKLFELIKIIDLDLGFDVRTSGPGYQALLLFASRLVNLNKLSLLLTFSSSLHWRQLGVVLEQMHRLETLHLYCQWDGGPPLHEILQSLELPSLRFLEIRMANFESSHDVFPESDGDEFFEHSGRESSGSRSSESSSPYRKGTSGITSLVIDSLALNAGTPELRELLAWPRALQHFSFKEDDPLYDPKCLCLPDFQKGLQPHRASLKSIHLCYVESRAGYLDLTEFTELESLEMHYWSILNSPEIAAMTMVSPKLHTVTFDAVNRSTEDYRSCFRTIDQKAAQWLLHLSQCAKAQGSALKEIQLRLDPNPYGYVENGVLDVEGMNVWVDMLETLQQQTEKLGVNITFVDPSPTREEFQTFAERLRSGEVR